MMLDKVLAVGSFDWDQSKLRSFRQSRVAQSHRDCRAWRHTNLQSVTTSAHLAPFWVTMQTPVAGSSRHGEVYVLPKNIEQLVVDCLDEGQCEHAEQFGCSAPLWL